MTKLLCDGDLFCKNCSLYKNKNLYHLDNTSKRGYAYYCKECANSKARAWTKKNKQNPNYIKSKQDQHYKTTYGLSVDQREQMFKSQDEKCMICRTKLLLGTNTHTDHCHTTGKVRGLLCGNCNRGLGSFKDNIESLQNAITYLENN